MAKYRKLGRTASQRKALLRNQVTMLLQHGKIRTTEAKAKEIRKIAEGLIASAVKEKDNFEEVTIKAKVAKKDAEGKRVKEVVDGKKVTVYDEVEKTIKKDNPSRLHARRQMLKVLYPVTEVPTAAAGKKKERKGGSGEQDIEVPSSERKKSERMKELRKRQAERRDDEEERVKQYADAYDVEEVEIETDNIEDFDAIPDDFNGEDKGDY